ncbi:hypothetical protein SAMN05421858_2899 [Haladaptatus litoreus]|uniref:RecA-superfamily ATPase, KaiC/GvpD/RAD55 family n=1 Tax=Haladaptatus litoreus TaxID=553468 RepID=A0A1N7C1M8_9EURY|nr:hypothetical protein [Haladaptatus litoreus]SIR57462.1 hypothetical protein SAMN05421858_2899 [Haladaptatus litoreus]
MSSVPASLDGESSILVLAPSMSTEADETCIDLLTQAPSEQENVLWVTFTRSPDGCLQDWLSHAGGRPANLRFLSVGETVRSVAASSSMQETPNEAVIDTLSNPGDLTGLGIKVSEILQQWHGNSYETVACFHSLTALLQYSDVQTVYKFLHVLTGRFATAGVSAHFHLDPEAHDSQTINTLKTLFDAVAELEDGDWSVRTR